MIFYIFQSVRSTLKDKYHIDSVRKFLLIEKSFTTRSKVNLYFYDGLCFQCFLKKKETLTSDKASKY